MLFFVNNEEDCNSILDWQDEGAEINDNLFDVCLLGEAGSVDFSSYLAVALPYGAANVDNLAIQSAFAQNTYIYLYGSLTISDYKESVGLEDFSLNVGADNVEGNVNQVKQYLDREYEQEEVFNVIG